MATSRGIIWRYYIYRATLSNGFFLPVGILYLRYQGFGLAVIGLTQAAFAFAVVAAEIPTGYLGDRIGRRASLAIGNSLTAIVMGAYVLVDSSTAYVVLYLLWGVGSAFRSGTGEAWLYELLEARFDESTFARISGRGESITLVVSAVTAIAAGILVTVNWALPFLANAVLSGFGILVLSTLPSVEVDTNDSELFTIRDATQMLRLQVGRPEIRWFIAYSALFYGLFDVTRAFEQPAAVSVGIPVAALGVLYAGFKLVSAGAASQAGWIEQRIGIRQVFVLLVPVVGFIYAAIAFVPLLVVPVFFLYRSFGTVLRPIRNQYLNDRLDDVGRATVLSGVSMILSLAGGVANLIAGRIAEVTGVIQFLAGAGVVVAGAAGFLWLLTSPVRSQDESANIADEKTSTTD
jgi:MFS family permease